MTSLEDDIKSFDSNSASMTSTAEPELGTAQPQIVSCKNYTLIYRDDPKTANLKPAILQDFLKESSSTEYNEIHEDGLDPEIYCHCGHCTFKPTLKESVCCKSLKTSTEHIGNLITCF